MYVINKIKCIGQISAKNVKGIVFQRVIKKTIKTVFGVKRLKNWNQFPRLKIMTKSS